MAGKSSNSLLIPVGIVGALFFFKDRLMAAARGLRQVPPMPGAINLSIKIAGVHAETNGELMMDLKLQNPSSQPFTIQAITGQLFAGKLKVADVKFFGSLGVRPASETTAPVQIQPTHLLSAAKYMRGQAVTFIGNINVNNSLLPLSMTYRP